MSHHRKWNKSSVIQELRKLTKKLKRRPVKRDNSNLYFLTRKYFGAWNNAMKVSGFEIKKQQTIKIPKELTQDFAYFLGILLTDGHLVFDKKYRRYKVAIYNSYEEEKELLKELINRIFDYKASVYKRKLYGFNKRVNYEISLSSKELCKYLCEKYSIPYGAKSLKVVMPPIFFKTSTKNISSFLRGVIDGDGSISSKTFVKISSGSINFLNSLKKVLSSININSGAVIADRNNQNINYIYISGRENLNRLYGLLYKNTNFYYPRKKRDWENKIFKKAL